LSAQKLSCQLEHGEHRNTKNFASSSALAKRPMGAFFFAMSSR
jgi:hypothetical protein